MISEEELQNIEFLLKTDDIANWIIALESMRSFKKENRDAENEVFFQMIRFHNRVTHEIYTQVLTFFEENFENKNYAITYPTCTTMTDYFTTTKGRRKGFSASSGIMISDVNRTGSIILKNK